MSILTTTIDSDECMQFHYRPLEDVSVSEHADRLDPSLLVAGKKTQSLIRPILLAGMLAMVWILIQPELGSAQTLSPYYPSKEYINVGGKALAIEEAPLPANCSTPQIMPGGPAVTVTNSTPGQLSSRQFCGLAGQRVSLLANNVSGTGGPYCVFMNKPDGQSIGWHHCLSPGYQKFFDATTLLTGGNYTIWVEPRNNGVGSVTLTLYDVPPDPVQTVTPTTQGAQVVVAPTTVPGQNAAVTFSGTAGQRIAFLASGVTGDSGVTVDVGLSNPNGTSNGGAYGLSAGQSWFSDIRTLGADGTYTIWINPRVEKRGGLTLTVYLIPADTVQTTTPTAEGAVVVVPPTTVPGQNAKVTFSGTAGQRIGFRAYSVTGDAGATVDVSLSNPNGTANGGGYGLGQSWFSDLRDLTSDGTYTIWINPRVEKRGGLTLTVYLIPADTVQTITPTAEGAVVVVPPTTVPGQNAKVTFSGTAGQRIAFRAYSVTGDAGVTVDVSLSNPNGTANGGGYGLGQSWFSDIRDLTSNGTYTIWVNPRVEKRGGLTLTVYLVPADTVQTVTPTPGGAVVIVPPTTVPAQNARVTFTGTAGQQISFVANSVTGDTGVGITVTLTNPNGSQNGGGYTLYAGQSWSSGLRTLPSNGTYTIWVNPQFERRGGATLTVTGP